ncbi:hypothetical protein FQ085_06615 [Planococcus sp. ANT_H30]|uniref:hypothetical protein n=1 Tax=Planococcus sp. ANT_H30 TaxID=2597347 RepID=UPI0011EFDCB5|nr:hypothetical protein [Planococcus sp. ANT_H30]KAA0957719.1 hypothetical protein FQ085_06615 [Planococcus sp. ANT_H30]
MNHNEEVRNEFQSYLKDNGVKMGFVASEIGIPLNSLSKWRNSYFDFRIDKLIMIKKYLKEKAK